MAANAAAQWINSVFGGFDIAVSTFIYNLFYPLGNFFTPFFEFISFLAHDGIPLIIFSIILIIFKKTRRFGTAMLISIAVGALFTNCCLKILIARPRPYADTASYFYSKWLTVGMNMESDKSFPSGHTTAAFALCTAVFLCGNRKKSWTAYIFAILIGISRIYLMVHFPSDVVAGVIVGIIAGIIGTAISMKIPYKWYGSRVFKTLSSDSISDIEHTEDFESSQKFKSICPGKLGIYFTKSMSTIFIPYDQIERVFIRIREIHGDDFGPYQYFTFILKKDGKEIINDVNFSDEKTAKNLIQEIKKCNPDITVGI